MMRGMGIRIQDAFQGPFRKKKTNPVAKVPRQQETERFPTDSVRISYLSRQQLEEAAQAERYLLENLDHGSDFKHLFFLQHQFLIIELQEPSFCDLCGLLIWGVYRLSLRCRNCSLICHPQCKQFLRLVCPKPRPPHPIVAEELTHESDPASESEPVPDESSQSEPIIPSTPGNYVRPLAQKVAAFNESFPFALLQLEPDGSYTGFVRIILRLRRPITVANGPFPGARVTSFYLPKNAEKLIHVSSLDSTSEVISAILSKFYVKDDARKFGLHLEGSDGCKRLSKKEYPLQLVLKAHEISSECCRLILEETNTKNVLWDAFTLPELENFKLILDKEEEEWLKLTRQNYAMYRKKLQAELDSRKTADIPSSTSPD